MKRLHLLYQAPFPSLYPNLPPPTGHLALPPGLPGYLGAGGTHRGSGAAVGILQQQAGGQGLRAALHRQHQAGAGVRGGGEGWKGVSSCHAALITPS